MNDVNCPYCNEENEICHDDGYGFEEDKLHEQDCCSCGKSFTFTTSISYYYEAFKADCLNGGEHKYRQTHTYPIECTRMQCSECQKYRQPTEKEWEDIKKSRV